MTTLTQISTAQIIQRSLKKAISYEAYRDLVHQLAMEGSTTGNDKTEAYIHYTKLNDRRMKRWDKTIKVSDAMKEKVSQFNQRVTWLVITESWCGDAAHMIPVLNKIAELSDHIDLRLVMRDDNEDLMSRFLTNGNKAIAKLIMLDTDTNEVLGTYGPRPSEATQMVVDYKAAHGTLTAEFKEALQMWYNANKGQNILEDALELLKL